MNSLKGSFLIASPQLEDPNFCRSVVLIMEHNAEGAFGLIMNRPASASIRDFWEEIEHETAAVDGPIYLGGPVEGPIICIHNQEACTEGEIVPGVFVAMRRDHLQRLVTESGHELRIFVGYSGWGPNQLEGEMAAGGWLTLPATAPFVFSQDVSTLWHRSMLATGQQLYRKMLGLGEFPDDPQWN